MTPDEKDALLKEHRTWQLFRTVYRYVIHLPLSRVASN